MRNIKNRAHVYGFEDYSIVSIRGNVFQQSYDYYLPDFLSHSGSYIITKDLPVKVVETCVNSWKYSIGFEPAICEDHKELLDTAKKVYTHPSCKLSRSMMAGKYKKSLDPFLSDAVVVPNPDFSELSMENECIFINEKAKILVKISFYEQDETTVSLVNSLQEGQILRSLVTCGFQKGWGNIQYSIEDMLDSEFVWAGSLLYIPNSVSYIMDILTASLPLDKIVFERSLQESLGCEDNQITFENLTSIKDMLDSSDDNTVSAGLKALSMMDWVHYPNSVRYVMKSVDDKWNWIYNHATSSTSVKYMLSTIAGNIRKANWPGDYDRSIYKEDYELFKQLKIHYDNIQPDRIMEFLRYANFMYVSPSGAILPNIKERGA